MSAILSVSLCRVSDTAGELDTCGSSITLNSPFTAEVVPSGSWWLGADILRRLEGGMGRPQLLRLCPSVALPVLNDSPQSSQGYL